MKIIHNVYLCATSFAVAIRFATSTQSEFMSIKTFIKAALVSVLMTAGLGAGAQDKGYDVFTPIGKYLAEGHAEKLSAWFSDNLEITIFSSSNDASRSQARQIMKSFFKSYTPRSFEVTHTAGRSNMKYALGTLNAGGEVFLVTIFVALKDDSYQIQQIKIERL